jgi:hypothetical protein
MALPRFIDIDGRRYLWRDLMALRRAQATPAEQQLLHSPCKKITGRPVSATPPSAIANRACSPCRSDAIETVHRGEQSLSIAPCTNIAWVLLPAAFVTPAELSAAI